MKRFILTVILLGALGWSGDRAWSAETKDAKTQLNELVGRIRAQLAQGKNTATDLAPFLKEFDTLLAQHKGEKTEDVARILFLKASLYAEVMDNVDQAMILAKQLKSDYPETSVAKSADQFISDLQRGADAKKIQRQLAVGSKFPDFKEKDLQGKPLAIANYKGKVVLLDFWATWCGPCVGELPNVLKTYQKFHPKGFEIIGISLDEKEEALTSFLKKQEMTWAQYFDGKGWGNKLAVQYGITAIPATYLLDGEGKIIAKDLRGEALTTAVEKALAKP
jgi:peroxiredoxin